MEALPDMGLKRASGIISAGMWIRFIMGVISLMMTSIKPELLRAPTDKKIPMSVGKMFTTTCMPSLAPSTKVSYTLFFSRMPYRIMSKMTIGTAMVDI